jgi:hypothetical protein
MFVCCFALSLSLKIEVSPSKMSADFQRIGSRFIKKKNTPVFFLEIKQCHLLGLFFTLKMVADIAFLQANRRHIPQDSVYIK